MKYILFIFLFLFLFSCREAENRPVIADTQQQRDTNIISKELVNRFAPTDISPVDISYFPPDYAVKKMSQAAPALPVMRIIYSRPHKQGRKIFGSLIRYGEPWRMGANESTDIEFFRPVVIQDKTVAKGRYIMYCVPSEKTWDVVLNSNIYSWGLKQDTTKDIHRFQVPAQRTGHPVEYFTMVFQNSETGAELLIVWDDVQAKLPITIQ